MLFNRALIFLLLSVVLVSTNSNLIKFLEEKDSSSSNKVGFKYFPKRTYGYVGHIQMYAKEPIKEGETVYTYNIENTINQDTIWGDEEVGTIFKEISARWNREENNKTFNDLHLDNDEERVHLYDEELMRAYLIYIKNKEGSKWSDYLKALPERFTTPIYWNDDEIEELKGSPIYNSIRRIKNGLNDEYERFKHWISIYPQLKGNSNEGDKGDNEDGIYSIDNFYWSFSVYNSRTWLQSRKYETPLLPLMDTFNYKELPSVAIYVDNDTDSISLIATEDIDTGEYIYIKDIELSNKELLESYGFVLVKNDIDSIDVGVGLDNNDNLYRNKLQLFHKRGIKDGQIFQIRNGDIPDDLIFALRIYHASVYDYDWINNAIDDKYITVQNELKVTDTLIQMCESSLNNYKSTASEDKKLLKDKELPPRIRNAIILRRSEKKILLTTLTKAKSIRKQVKDNWNMRTIDIGGTDALKATLHGGGDSSSDHDDDLIF